MPGVIAGGVSACATFVIQSSRGSNIRGVFSGEAVRSNTSWPARYRDKLDIGLAKHGVYVIQLQGHIFFGNIQQLVKQLREIIETASHEDQIATQPIDHQHSCPEYVVLDCSFVSGLDNNAVDGLLSLQAKLQCDRTDGGLSNIVLLSFAGLQPSMQNMFSSHIELRNLKYGYDCNTEQTTEFNNVDTVDDIEMSTHSIHSEQTGLLAESIETTSDQPQRISNNEFDIATNKGKSSIELQASNKHNHHRAQSLDISINSSPNSSNVDGKHRLKRNLSAGNLFHMDVNTALQHVEENIIGNVNSR